MKQLLLLSYDALPGGAPGAALRSMDFAARLPQHGWMPSILCARGGTAGPRLRRVTPPTILCVSAQAEAWAWAHLAQREAERWMAEREFDLIYASCPPFPAARTAVALGQRSGKAVVLDFRDAWSMDPHATGGPLKRGLKNVLRRTAYRAIEARCLRAATLVLTNTPSMDIAYRAAGVPDRRRRLLPNGFVPEHFHPAPSPRPASSPARIMYCGRFRAVAGRNPTALMQAVARLREAGHEVVLEVLGDEDPWLRRCAARSGLDTGLVLRPAVSPAEAVAQLQGADVAVVLQHAGQGPVQPIAGKTYEAIRAGRPILGLVPEGDNASVLRDHAGRWEQSPLEATRIAAALERLLADASRQWPPSADFLQQFDRAALAQRLAQLLDEACTAAPRR